MDAELLIVVNGDNFKFQDLTGTEYTIPEGQSILVTERPPLVPPRTVVGGEGRLIRVSDRAVFFAETQFGVPIFDFGNNYMFSPRALKGMKFVTI